MPAQTIYYSRTANDRSIAKRGDPVIHSCSAPAPQTNLEKKWLDDYEKNGFVVIDNCFDEQTRLALLKEACRLKEQAVLDEQIPAFRERDSGDVRSVFRVHKLSDLFQKTIHDPRLVKLARYILDDDVYIHQSRINYKPAFTGKEFYWHSDFETWHMEDGMPSMRALSISITLTENMDCNGPLMLIPGSHSHYIRCCGETPDNHYQQSLVQQRYGVPDPQAIKHLADEGGIFTATTRPGSVIVFDCNTLHGSNGNISPYPRVNLFFVYNAVSNQLVEPYCGKAPRPEFLAARQAVEKL